MTLYAKKDKELADLPSIWWTEGRFMLDCGIEVWRRRWGEVYQFEVEHWENPKGWRLNLDSLITATYPALEGDPIARASFANNFLWRLREERRRSAKGTKERRLAREKNGGVRQ